MKGWDYIKRAGIHFLHGLGLGIVGIAGVWIGPIMISRSEKK